MIKVLVILLLTLLVIAMMVGTVFIWPIDFMNKESVHYPILWDIRAPRIIVCALVGAGLAMSGMAFQQLFRNPLASPDLLGVSSGAALGALLALLLNWRPEWIQALAFAGGLLVVACVSVLANVASGRDRLLHLILLGAAIASVASACMAIIKILADPLAQLPSMTFWLMGSFSAMQWPDVQRLAITVSGCGVVLWLCRWRMQVFELATAEAQSVGINVLMLRFVVIVTATICTAATVAHVGLIAWVGLMVPHMARWLVGLRAGRLLPVTALMGAYLLVLVDLVSRALVDIELPPGIFTSLLGAPFLLFLLWRQPQSHL